MNACLGQNDLFCTKKSSHKEQRQPCWTRMHPCGIHVHVRTNQPYKKMVVTSKGKASFSCAHTKFILYIKVSTPFNLKPMMRSQQELLCKNIQSINRLRKLEPQEASLLLAIINFLIVLNLHLDDNRFLYMSVIANFFPLLILSVLAVSLAINNLFLCYSIFVLKSKTTNC